MYWGFSRIRYFGENGKYDTLCLLFDKFDIWIIKREKKAIEPS